MFPIGHQRVGIVTTAPVLDGGGNPVVDEQMVPETTDAVVWVDGCLFEVQVLGPALIEQVSDTTTTSEIAWCHLPVTDDTRAITSEQRLRHANLTYEMRGDAVIEIDIRGREHHVFALCERQQG